MFSSFQWYIVCLVFSYINYENDVFYIITRNGHLAVFSYFLCYSQKMPQIEDIITYIHVFLAMEFDGAA